MHPMTALVLILMTAMSTRLPAAAVWPVGERPLVVRAWEPPPSPYAAGHRGADLAAGPGDLVRASSSGRVSFAGPVAGRGVLSITLPDTGDPPLRTTYEPVRALVAKGDEVTAGQVVAVLQPGPFHCPSACLHWGLLRAKTYLNPLTLLPPHSLHRGPPRLLPVFGVPEATGTTDELHTTAPAGQKQPVRRLWTHPEDARGPGSGTEPLTRRSRKCHSGKGRGGRGREPRVSPGRPAAP
ncbi:M23 family metallopeptidase [Streptomyces sp. ISL-100]|uniref:M23 family metallopeptidase n=1 Tax=Streptomyces sp. ISL-100 TaxID=2819173 RepID=UPI001BE661FA|nr:M23 family metallopeptidase [Streptomyces sp. ISL-100]MBT2399208.1 M23 family metallopeptidase [Streptomyces sp. ISL-100]